MEQHPTVSHEGQCVSPIALRREKPSFGKYFIRLFPREVKMDIIRQTKNM
jgi:hypothetical protein